MGYQPTEIEGPHGLAVGLDGEHWYLSIAHGKPFGLVYKYRMEDDELVGETEVGMFPATMEVSAATGLLYVANFNLHGRMLPSSISVVDPDAMVEVERVTTGPMPHGSRVGIGGRKHYSCAMMSGHLFELDAVSMEVSRRLQLDEERPEAHDSLVKPTWVDPHPTASARSSRSTRGSDRRGRSRDLERHEAASNGSGPLQPGDRSRRQAPRRQLQDRRLHRHLGPRDQRRARQAPQHPRRHPRRRHHPRQPLRLRHFRRQRQPTRRRRRRRPQNRHDRRQHRNRPPSRRHRPQVKQTYLVKMFHLVAPPCRRCIEVKHFDQVRLFHFAK